MKRHRRISHRIAGLVAILVTTVVLGASPAIAQFQDPGNVETNFATVDSETLDFVGVSAGQDFSLGWTFDGQLYAWGTNGSGQLGTGDTVDRNVPTLVPFPSGTLIQSASAGTNVSIALSTTGQVFTWGNNSVTAGTNLPGLVPALSGSNIVGVSGGGIYFLAWSETGQLYSWGNNGSGRLGRGVSNVHDVNPALVTAQGANTRTVVMAEAGRFHGSAVFSDGTVVGWGEGYGVAGGSILTGLPAGMPEGVATGNGITIVWTSDGQLYQATGSPAASLVTGLETVVVEGAAVSIPNSGGSSFFAWDAGGQLYSWGLNTSGQLGLGDNTNRPDPTFTTLPLGTSLAELSAGTSHTLLSGTTGLYSAAGSNSVGQLGSGDFENRNVFSTPVLIERWPM